MQQKIEKGSEEWQFFKDYWNLRSRYHDADNGEEWFAEMMAAGEKIMERYKNMPFGEYARKLVFDHFEDVEKRWREKNEQHFE